MKSRYLVFILTTLTIVALVGCEREGIENHVASGGVRIYTSSTMTRTTFQDDNMVTHVRWNANDGILVSSGKQKNVLYRALESQNGTTEFIPEREELSVSEGKMVYATYPFANLYYDNSLPDSIIEVRRQEPLIDKNNACQDVLYAANKVENGKINLQFKHLFTFIKVILPKKSLGNTTWVQLRSNAIIDYDEMLFDIKNERIVGGRPLNFTYNIDISGAESDDMNVYLYFAILPQPENVAITLWNCDYRDNSEKFFFSRKTPTGGMKAGCMYVMDINSDKLRQEEQRDKKILVDFYQATNGPAWKKQSNWCSDAPLNEWYGVKGLSNMVQLDLVENNLNGTLSESFATLLDNVDVIDLRHNHLHGEIPEAMKTHPRWNELGWNIVADQYPLGFDACVNGFTNESPRSGFDFSKGNTNLFLHDMDVTLIDGNKEKLMNIISRNKLTQILVHFREAFDSPLNISDRRVNLHLDYQNKGFGTIVEIGYNGDPIDEEWKDFANDLPTRNFVFIDGYVNSIIPISLNTGLGHNLGDVYLINSQGELVDHFQYMTGEDKLEEWYCHKIDSVVRTYCGNPEEHPAYSRQLYTSTDYSRDGESFILQKASTSKGIDLVFMGEAFVDKDMGDGGKYEQKMKDAMEQFFSIEPYKTFRNRFNVYAVKVISPNAEFGSMTQHRINESEEICFEYAKKVTGRNPSQVPMVSVIYNIGDKLAGRSYTVIYSDGTFVGYMMEGVNEVLNHEVGGHGFAKLLDEYIEPGNEYLTLPKDEREALDYQWQEFGWGANVDWRNDRNTVKWAHLLNDSRYASEGLGLYEGANYYGYGAYRPTMNSMMRYNDTPFNAPSREQIYKCIMRQSEGEGWTYNYEDFVRYDAVNRNNATTRSLKTTPSEKVRDEWKKRHRPPVFVNGTWRDAVKKRRTKNSTIVPLR